MEFYYDESQERSDVLNFFGSEFMDSETFKLLEAKLRTESLINSEKTPHKKEKKTHKNQNKLSPILSRMLSCKKILSIFNSMSNINFSNINSIFSKFHQEINKILNEIKFANFTNHNFFNDINTNKTLSSNQN